MSWFLLAVKNYAGFRGRAARKEYWYFLLFYLLIFATLTVVDILLGLYNETNGFGLFSTLSLLALLIPSWAVSVRRMHDTGRTGWWAAVVLIPLIGMVIFLILAALQGEAGCNEYGDNPCVGVGQSG